MLPATPTHKGLKGVFDGTSTQVVPWMINNWRAKIIEREIYNIRDPGGIKEVEIKKETL